MGQPWYRPNFLGGIGKFENIFAGWLDQCLPPGKSSLGKARDNDSVVLIFASTL
jgi:hypothetical protein